MVKLNLITAPLSEPVTLTEAKAHLRLETTLDDIYVTSLITAARMYTEGTTWRALINQVWELVMDGFPGCYPSLWVTPSTRYVTDREIELPRGDISPVGADLTVKYDDNTGAEQTFASSNYIVDATPMARLVLKSTSSWPLTNGEVKCVRIRFKVGFGDAASDVPLPIKQAILLLISQMYEHRTPEVTGTIISKVGFAVEALLERYRLNKVG